MNDERVRAQVAKALNREDLPDRTWEIVREDVLVDATSITPAIKRELIAAARAALTYGDFMAGSAPEKKERLKPKEPAEGIGEHEIVRARAMGAGIAYRCTLDTRVQDFRKQVLDGKLLGSKAARSFAESYANTRFPLRWFEEQGVPMTSHQSDFSAVGAEYDTEEDEIRDVHFTEVEDIWVSPPDAIFKARLPRSVRFEELPVAWVSCRPVDDPDAAFVAARNVYPGSVMDGLRILSAQLVQEEFCRPWNEADVAGFILTGIANTPKVLVGRAEDHQGTFSPGTITLKVDPCVSPDTVCEIYKILQLTVSERDRNARPPAPRNMRVFRFVMEQMTERRTNLPSSEGRSGAAWFPWPELKERWNASNPEGTYPNTALFKRAYSRAVHVLRSEKDPEQATQHTEMSIPPDGDPIKVRYGTPFTI